MAVQAIQAEDIGPLTAGLFPGPSQQARVTQPPNSSGASQGHCLRGNSRLPWQGRATDPLNQSQVFPNYPGHAGLYKHAQTSVCCQ